MSEQETEPATKICPFCAEQILADARKCRYCGEFLVAQKEKSGIESLYQMLAITGSLLLVIAPFAPLASAPIVGRITLFNKGQGDGIVLLVVAVVSLVLALFRHYGFLWLSGTIGIFAFGNLLFFFYHRLPEIIHDYNAETRGNPFNSIGQIGLANFDADWA